MSDLGPDYARVIMHATDWLAWVLIMLIIVGGFCFSIARMSACSEHQAQVAECLKMTAQQRQAAGPKCAGVE